GVCRVSVDGAILTANAAYARMLGYDSVEQFLGEVSHVRQLSLSAEARRHFVKRLNEREVITGWEAQIPRRDGSFMTGSGQCRAVRDHGGRIVAVEVVIMDVTDRKNVEERYRALSEISSDYAFITRFAPDGSISSP